MAQERVGRKMEDSYEINRRFPVSNEREYTTYLHQAYVINYAGGMYQFAFLAYYMLLMAFISFKVWQVNRTPSGGITLSKPLKKRLGKERPPLSLDIGNTEVNRHVAQFIDSFLSTSVTLKDLMRLRNDVAHVNGRIRITYDILEQTTAEISEIIEEIEHEFEPVIRNCYFNFLLDSKNVEEREYLEDEDQVQEVLIRGNYLSEADISLCARFDITILKEHEGFNEMKALHEVLLRLYPLE